MQNPYDSLSCSVPGYSCNKTRNDEEDIGAYWASFGEFGTIKSSRTSGKVITIDFKSPKASIKYDKL